ncbi:DNA repair protein RecO [Fulvimarina endophytica]|uniref:DNA repair protein RecO n=1 Tax=Fulvimarina endophytica TaxID=2293836 RepID=A0A371WZY7_9HYPH|nr:DNA repair protein RecO [Fulvimarina endophytica]RFC62532.1 DNA repair protein RecO [Fulvimarina endophytica]
MEWREEGVVLGVKRHGETSVIAELMTRSRGRHLGLVRGGRSRAMRAVLQPGNSVAVHWRARLDEHMGAFSLEPAHSRAGQLMETAIGLNGVQLAASHLRLLAEREPHARLYDGFLVLLDNLGGERLTAGELMLRFELAVLEELGFGLDLARCAASGATVDLVYVSPKSGRAVGREPGEPYRDKLLALPGFLTASGRAADGAALREGFAMTRYFLARHIYEPRGLDEPLARLSFISAASGSE